MEEKIFIDGEERGTLKIRSDGIYTVMEAEIFSNEELMRLYVQGDEKTFSLGIMEPKGKKAVLRKRLSKIEMKKFPQNIQRVIALPLGQHPAESEKAAKDIVQPAKRQEIRKESQKNYWIYKNGDLFFITEEGRFLAFPTELRKEVPGLRLKKYKNRQYMLFRY